MNEINQLHRKRGGIKAKLTNLKKFVDNISKDNIDKQISGELHARSSAAQIEIQQAFNAIQDQIECICEEQFLQNEYGERDQFETKYYNLIGTINSLIQEFSNHKTSDDEGSIQSSDHVNSLQPSSNSQNNLENVKLPTIDLPKYRGDYTGCLEFKDIFISLIHSNSNINNTQKFHYLRASLEGTAAQVIQSIEFSSSNYDIAWGILCERFDNNHLLVHNHIKAIVEQPNVNKDSSASFRHMIDNVSKHLRSLDILQQKEQTFDSLIIYILLNKVDIKTAKDWEEKKCGDTPTLNDFKEFLKTKADLLETLEAHTNKKVNTYPQQKPQRQKTFASSIVTCTYCKGNHQIYQCGNFLKLSTKERLNQVKNFNLCFNCLRTGHGSKICTLGGCKKCNSKHNTLLHLETFWQQLPVTQSKETISQTQQPESTFNASIQLQGRVLLATVLVNILDKHGKALKCRAMLDCGSESHFITNQLCEKLGLQKTETKMSIVGINQIASKVNHECTVTLKSMSSNFQRTIRCLTIDVITDNLNTHTVDIPSFELPSNVALADPEFGKTGQVDLLIGAALFWNIILDGRITLGKHDPHLQNSVFGWIIVGNLPIRTQGSTSLCHFSKNIDIQHQMQQFWELEEYLTPYVSIDDEKCEEFFNNTTTRDNQGRFIVSIPFKYEPNNLGNSREFALKRYFNLEKRFERQPKLKESYVKFMKEYEELGHMSKVSSQETKCYYLPHHGVLKEDSLTTKLRVVFDGSMPSDNGISLNDIQYIGQNMQQDLISIFIRFRQHRYVFIADITKMYRQILVKEEDRKFQRIFWRPNSNSELLEYELNTVTYGTRSAPYLAIRCVKQLAREHKAEYPAASEIIERDFYVDDLMSGSNTIEEASRLCQQITDILATAGLELRKWSSNDAQILKHVDNSKHTRSLQQFGDSNFKVLGIQWSCESDILGYKINNTYQKHVTKRSVLSEISQIFDPLGLLAPFVVKIKVLMQKLWKFKLSWDSQLPIDLEKEWLLLRNELTYLNKLQIPRYLLCDQPVYIELHGFCDSSLEAYGACVYVRSISATSDISIHLVCAKTRVAPLKTLTIPRLELCGALTLSRLMQKVGQSFTFKAQYCYWTDSQVVLAWLNSDSSSLQTFVSNRVGEIQRTTNINNWKYVNTKDNPADLLSRGINSAKHLQQQHLWWHGPSWLRQGKETWPIEKINTSIEIPEIKLKFKTLMTQEMEFLSHRYSSLNKLKKITALCLRFLHNCRNTMSKTIGPITPKEYHLALQKLIVLSQNRTFIKDINLLKRDSKGYKGRLQSLCPFLDEYGILRVGGRLQKSSLSYNTKHPILLCGKDKLSVLICRQEHINLLHAGPQQLLYAIRENFWITGGRNLAKQTVRQCIKCFRARPTSVTPLMGELPAPRVNPNLPFLNTGTDFAGPFHLRERLGKNPKHFKCYICIFICLSTKAIHLEPLTDLTTDSFIATFKRFISRRGVPSHMYSDNGSTYVKASKELAVLGDFMQQYRDQLINKTSLLGISWHFIPPYSPNFGGIWEAVVKSTKFHLRRIFTNEAVTFEHFLTFLVMIEGILNSRPLTPLTSDPHDLRPLTPAHFLICRPITSIPEPDYQGTLQNRLTIYQRIQQMKQSFWKQWSHDYLTELQVRSKWNKTTPDIAIGTLVLLKDNTPPSQWRLGRILDQIHGSDGVARVVKVKTNSGIATSFDVRGKPLAQARHWSAPEVFGTRAYFRTVSEPAHLVIEDVRRHDEGLYRCRVDYRNAQTRTYRYNVSVIVPPDQPTILDKWGRLLHGTVGPYEEGDDVTLTCRTVGGHPQPKVRWLVNGIIVDDEYEHNAGKVIENRMLWRSVKRKDLNAIFTCQAVNTLLTEPKEARVMLDLHLKPLTATIKNAASTLIADKRYVVTCESTGSRPPAIITWYKGKRQLRRTREETRENITTSELSFVPTTEDDKRYVTCRAENPNVTGLYVETSWKINVVYPPIVSLCLGSTLNPDDIKEGDDVYFECHVKSNPEWRRLTWLHNKRVLHHNMTGRVIHSNQSLVLQKVSRHSSGIYVCSVVNSEGETLSNEVEFRVQYAPICKSNKVMIIGASRGESVDIICQVVADPPVKYYRWKFNNSGETLDVGAERFSKTSNGSVSVLRYTPVSELDYGSLSCWGVNKIGTQNNPCVFQVVAAAKPFPVRNCTLLNQTTDSVEVVCLPGFDGGLQQYFLLELYSANSPVPRFNVTSQDDPYFFLGNLEPDITFRIVIFAINAKGRSNGVIIEELVFKDPEKRTAVDGEISFTPILGIIIGAVITLIVVIILIVIRVRRTHSPTERVVELKISDASNQSMVASSKPLLRSSPKDSDERDPDIIPANYGSPDGECSQLTSGTIGGNLQFANSNMVTSQSYISTNVPQWSGPIDPSTNKETLFHQYSNPVAFVGTFPRDSRPRDLRLGNGNSNNTIQKTGDLELNGLAIKERLMANRLPESCV